ncbi:unnamed protein product [Thlaspi arvense]|uniref:U3 small nucleolar RNA-associated protein 6 homolog C-terminal domain-containing protein n=1 Tax=Thlaspi arvense TaxID=13288 RepID=A0AAU9S5L6_THLAR|nr:unnamed protein product [Thlaspi arvense]
MKKSLSDLAGVSRILEIYRLATNRFKGDIELWFQYLEFCRQRRNGRMKKVLAQVIRFHPKVPGVWIYAAAWEFDQNLNAAAARALMQSGLRVCPTSEDLWVEYLRMELTYLNKLKARKVALGEDKGTLICDHEAADEKQWRDENKELFMGFDEKRENDEASDIQNTEAEKKVDLFREQGLSILRTVYSGAIESVPSSFSLRTRFVEILDATDLAHSHEMREEILNDMKRDFSKEPEYWDWLARKESQLEKAMQHVEAMCQRGVLVLKCQYEVYDEAIKVVPSSAIFCLYIRFLKDAVGHNNGEVPSSGDFVSYNHILMVYDKAESMGCITEDLACEHISCFLQLGRLEEARKLAENLCNGKLSDAVDLWVLRLSVEMRCVTERCGYSRANTLTLNPFLAVSLNALKFFLNQKQYFDKLVELSLVSLIKDGGSDDGFSLSTAIVNVFLEQDGVQSARETYKRAGSDSDRPDASLQKHRRCTSCTFAQFLALPRPGLSMCIDCIELETNLALAGDRKCLLEARKLYESALATYEQDVSLWRNYYTMEIKVHLIQFCVKIPCM